MSSGYAIAKIISSNTEFELSGKTSNFGVPIIKPVDKDSSFDLASVTKVMCTTTVFMRASEDKTISLNDPISQFLPEWKNTEKSDLTIEDLLRHESGLEEWRPFYITCKNPEEVVEMISKLPLKYPKQREFHYSDLNFIILGAVLQRIYSSDLKLIFENQVAQPLLLTNTRFTTPIDRGNVVATSIGDSIERNMVDTKQPYLIPERAEDFLGWRETVLSGEINDGNAFHIFGGESGHAGLFSTLNDMTKYLSGLLGGFVTESTLHKFSQPRSNPLQAIGFRRFEMANGDFAIGHFGFTGTGFAINSEIKKGWVYLSNRLHTKSPYKTMNEIWCSEFKEFSFRG